MDDQKQDNTFMPEQDEASSPQPIRFHRPHISQEPINDPEPKYVTRNRYQTLEEAQTGRKHMGFASGDPVYLKDAPLSKNSTASDEPMKASATHQQRGPRPKQTLTHSARYLETPKQGKINLRFIKQTTQAASTDNPAFDHCGHSSCPRYSIYFL